MGGTSTSQQKSTSQTTPYAAAQPGMDAAAAGLTGLIPSAAINPTQTGAINTLTANANNGQSANYAGLLDKSATSLLGGGGAQNNDQGIHDAFASYRKLLDPYASGGMIGANSALQPYLGTLTSDITNNVNGQFAAAGRDMSPGNSQALGRGIAQGLSPVIAGQFNTDTDRALGAAGSIYGAGNTTYGMLNGTNAQANQNQQAGAGQASTALQATNYAPNSILDAEGKRFNIPAQNYTTLLGALSPVAQAFGQTNGTQEGSQTMSPVQQAAMLMQGFGSMLGLKNPAASKFGGLPA